VLIKLKPIFKIFEWLVFLALLFLFFIVVSPVLPLKFIPKTYVVLTGSMDPTIKPGSVALTVPTIAGQLVAGDIIAFASPDNPDAVILHRIDSIKSTDPLRFATKGDANNAPDDWDVVDVGVLGKYVFAIPYLGIVAAYIAKPVGFVLAIVVPALIFIVSQIIGIKKSIKQEIDKQVSQKTNKSDSIFPVIFFAILVSSLISAKVVKAVYFDTVTVFSLSISIADFDADTTPPVTHIITDSYTQTQTNFDISFTIDDDNPAFVELCHSFSLGAWSCLDVGLTSPFSFTASSGNGVYCFDTIGHDTAGNIETDVLPSPPTIDPLDPSLYCTQLVLPG